MKNPFNINKPSAGTAPNSHILKEYKKTITSLSQEQIEAAIGLILGDVHLHKHKNEINYRLKFEQGDKHKLYVDHLYELFKPWVLSEPRKVTRLNKNGNIVVTWQFQTFSHDVFTELANIFIKNNKKYVPKGLIENQLTPRGLAYWFSDDGGKLDYTYQSKNKGIVFNTQGFTEENVNQICLELSSKFNLNCSVKHNKNKPIITISSNSGEILIDLMDPYLIPSIKSKLPGNQKIWS